MNRHRQLNQSRRGRFALDSRSSVRLESRLLLSGAPTAGVYDENVVDPNTVDFVATGSSLTNTDFANRVAAAYSQNWGGVIDGEILGQLYSYGVSRSKVALTVQPATGNNWGISTGCHLQDGSVRHGLAV